MAREGLMLMCSLVAHLTELNGDIVAALDEIDVAVVSLATNLPCRHSVKASFGFTAQPMICFVGMARTFRIARTVSSELD